MDKKSAYVIGREYGKRVVDNNIEKFLESAGEYVVGDSSDIDEIRDNIVAPEEVEGFLKDFYKGVNVGIDEAIRDLQ